MRRIPTVLCYGRKGRQRNSNNFVKVPLKYVIRKGEIQNHCYIQICQRTFFVISLEAIAPTWTTEIRGFSHRRWAYVELCGAACQV